MTKTLPLRERPPLREIQIKKSDAPTARPIFVLGDLHGKFRELERQISRINIKDCHLICVGDLGMGFNYNRQGEIKGLRNFNETLKKRDISFLAIRGNHDDPQYFDGNIKFSHIELLADYTYRTIEGRSFLFVGGAISIDRKMRLEGKSYWRDEVFVYEPEKITERAEVLITHTGPEWIGPTVLAPIVQGWAADDATLIDDLNRERAQMTSLYLKVKPKKAYLGHFHESTSTLRNGTAARILDELEIIEIR